MNAEDDVKGATAVALQKLRDIGLKLTAIPASVAIHPTLKRVIENRRKMIETGEGLDWATGEHLAFGTLLDEGSPVRLSGQDSVRGTFSQRHSAVIDQNTEERYIPLNNIRPGQAHYEVIDSLLSEEAVLGFEYGFSLADPNTLVMWEAQFGDFVNGAQVVIDQFITSGERKWLRMCGLTMLLPHGYEGQGPEHSSARLERFLQMCAEDNMQVVNCTTPANYFHALRRQLKRSYRKPLIVMTPKSLLRHKKAVSKLTDFAEGSSFHRVLWDDGREEPRGRGPDRAAGRQDPPRRAVLRQGLLRSPGRPREGQPGRRRLHPAAGAVLSVADAVAPQGAGPLPQGRGGLVPGRAEEHGRLDLRRPLARTDARKDRDRRKTPPLRRAVRPRPRPPPA